jgi:hypothetical protein
LDVRENLDQINDEKGYHVMRSGERINSLLSKDLMATGADDIGVKALPIDLKWCKSSRDPDE